METTKKAPVVQDNSHLKNMAARAYSKQQQKPLEEQRIMELLPMVSRIVSKVTSYVQAPLTRDDLVSAGTIGLIKAAKGYDATKNADFKTYAYIRIRGAIIDELRGWSFAPANLNKQFKQIEQIRLDITEETSIPPTDEQIAEAMSISMGKLYAIYENARSRHFMSISGFSDEEPALGQILSTNDESPDARLNKEEMVAQLSGAITDLPQKQRQIIILYYQQELTMKEIAEVLEVTESRVSQLHASAVCKLGANMKDYNDPR